MITAAAVFEWRRDMKVKQITAVGGGKNKEVMNQNPVCAGI